MGSVTGHLPIPLTAMLHSSYVPSLQDRARVQESIDEVELAISAVDAERLRVHAALAELEGRRDQLEVTLATHQSIVAPIRSLPQEILREIFRFACAGRIVQWPFHPTETSLPWFLGRVCSYWRTTFLSVQGLWANIDLIFNMKSPPKNMGKVLSFLGTVLERSGEELLTVSVTADGAGVDRILVALLYHSRRWADLSLHVERLFEHYPPLFSLAKNSLPNLRRLHLSTSPSHVENVAVITNTVLDAFQTAPKLREVAVSKIANPFRFVHLPWSQITHYTSKFNHFHEGEYVQMLAAMPKLVFFSSERERVLEIGSSPPAELPHLKSLTVINKGMYMAKTLRCLLAPNLASLTINAITAFPQVDVMDFVRSQCKDTLTHLDLTLPNDTGPGVLAILMMTPNLTSLRLSIANPPEGLIERLSYFPQSNHGVTSLPKLTALELECKGCSYTASRAITDMLVSRMSGSRGDDATLQSIKVKLSSPPLSDFDSIREAGKFAGIDVDIEVT
ncbi:unnamed protein product [Cyclocybe aegerita]|uniref:F-box domain-containing protein n=1 Tax=Cyclocybe aegerita TaxID=1973307 RepID=A0A8S0WB36_CYCAE|nr:unnamed protein product [Cyclocybe aegerita]